MTSLATTERPTLLGVCTDLLRRGYGVSFRADGHSMHPTIRSGETIIVAPVSAGPVARGDIILYRAARGVIAHRVVRIEKRSGAAVRFIARGDGAPSEDVPIPPHDILGKVMAVHRRGGSVDLGSRMARLRSTLIVTVLRARRWTIDRLKETIGMFRTQEDVSRIDVVVSPVVVRTLE